ncbi:MAG: TetR/AcrR family transcriptional regulator [Pseudomonadota bacterium]
MTPPRYQRRKEDRPAEITAAAFETFAEKGYANARVEEVARRAGVSKGLLYLYFKTKEELFKAVIRSVVLPRVDSLLRQVEDRSKSPTAFIRGPVREFMQQLPGSPVAVIIKLMLTEGSRHPDLVEFYWDNVASRGLEALRTLLERGIANGEFRETRLAEFPHLVIAPVVMAVIFRLLFQQQTLDSDALIDTHIEILLEHLAAEPEGSP